VEFGGAPAGSAGGSGAVLELVPCPDQGPVIGTIPQGQEVLVTARSADGGWLQLYWPAPGIERAWTQAGPLELEGDAADLPVAACEAPPAPTARPTVEPTPTPAPTVTPTPTPEVTPTPTPVATATVSKPKLSRLTASTASISFDQGDYCPNAPTSVTISVAASDPEGIAGVTLRYRPPGTSGFLEKQMRLSNGRYVATLDTTTDNLRRAGDLAYYVVARDRAADQQTSRLPAKATSLAVKVCKNTGPKFALLEASPNSIIADPLNAGCNGSTLSELRARATDPDGVKSITLFFKKPGASRYTKREFVEDGDTWYSFVNTAESVDNIVRSGAISWYAVATDDKGAKTESKVRTIKVTRCDTEADFDYGGTNEIAYNGGSCSPTRITVQVYAQDADAGYPSDKLRVNLQWTAQNGRGAAFGRYSGTTRATFQKGNYFVVNISTIGWQNPGSWDITYRASSTDPFGGKSTAGFTGQSAFSLRACAN
jgi:hypothetical protein